MFEEFLNYIHNNRLFELKDRVLLAVSGGIDSMVMSHLFLKLGVNAGIAHCNFCLRNIESDSDEELVRKFTEENGMPFYIIRFKTKEYAAAKGISVQMAARELRYDWFEKIRKENNFDKVAIAHNLNDNVETLLINLTRGTGLTGLTGMRPGSNTIIRPLLFAKRKRIEEYCRDNNVPFREDKSNAETGYSRNKIRHKIIPVLMEINPAIEDTLNNTAKRLTGIDEILTSCIDLIRKQTSVKKDGTIVFNIEKLLKINPGEALIFEIFSPFGITQALSGDLIRLLSGETGKKIFTRTHRIVKNRNEVLVCPLEYDQKKYYVINSTEDLTMVPGVISAKILNKGSDFKIPEDRNIICIDLRNIKFPLIIRGWENGDYFYPLGMSHKKKLSDFFIDNKYSLPEKDQALVLESNGKIVWIIGTRIDERFKVTESTSKILLIHLFPCR